MATTAPVLKQGFKEKKRTTPAPLVKKNSVESFSSDSTEKTHKFRGISRSITGLLDLRRLSVVKSKDEHKPKPRFENTYKISPDEGMVFYGSKVRQIAEEVLEEELADKTYDCTTCGMLACDLAMKIKGQVKGLDMPRYKIVCQVVIGQVRDQGLEAVSRCVWDAQTDNYDCVTYKNASIFAVALIHGVYFE